MNNTIKKIIISWVLVLLWAVIIFAFSEMDITKSNNKSKSTINEIIDTSIKTTNDLGITDKHPSDSKKNKIIEDLNVPLRKFAHASEYFVLAILIIIALVNSNIQGKKIYFIVIIACFLYACTDEFHQTFINGRTGQFSDTLIDTCGGILGCIVYFLKNKVFKKNQIVN